MVVFSAIFIVLPVFGTRLIENLANSDLSHDKPLVFNLIEGGIRLSMFVGYLLLIGQFKDIRRVFQYHGAEHKTIYAYENGDPLDPKDDRRQVPDPARPVRNELPVHRPVPDDHRPLLHGPLPADDGVVAAYR